MLFNKWLLLIIEYTIQLEDNQPISNSQIPSQTLYNNSFDNLQHVKDDKNVPISLGALSFNQLQSEQRPVNQQLTKILNIIMQDLQNTTKQNTNIPEEREDEFDDEDSIEGDEEDDESDDLEEEIQHKNMQNRLEGESQNKILNNQINDGNQKSSESSNVQSEQINSQNKKSNQNNSCSDQNEQSLKDQDLSPNNDGSANSIAQKQFQLQVQKDQSRSFKEDEFENVKQQNTQSEENLQTIRKYSSLQAQEQAFENENNLNDNSTNNISNIENNPSKQNKQKQASQSNQSQIAEEYSQSSNPNIEIKKKSSDQSSDPNQIYEEEVNGSLKSIKRKSEDKSNRKIDSIENQKNRNEQGQSKKQSKASHIAKMDEEMKIQIQEEAQKICKYFDDKQLIQWDKNEILSILNKFKYFSDIEDIIEKQQIDGFILFTIINEDLQLHDITKILSISFTQASKLKNFIQILEPLRQQQVARIYNIKRVRKLNHSSSIETDYNTQNISPDCKNKNNNNSNQSSNSRQFSSQHINSKTFLHGSKQQKSQFKLNTFENLQDFLDYDDQKIQGNKILKNSCYSNTNPNLQNASSQMTFEIQTRDKLLSSTSDQDNQNSMASAEQSKNPMLISQDKHLSNYTILFSDSQTNLNLSKSKSPSQNRLTKTAFISQLNSNQNKANLGLSQHFNSEENQTCYDERRNINSQPTLGNSFHFEKNSQGCGQQQNNTLSQRNLAHSEMIQGLTQKVGRQPELINQQKSINIHNNLLNNELYPSKSTQLPQNPFQNNLVNQGNQKSDKNFNENQNILQEGEACVKQNEANINKQETNLGNSSYIEHPLGMSQKVEKQVTSLQNEGEIEVTRCIRKVSSNNTLFQSSEQQQLNQTITNNLINQNMSASQPQTNFINQSNYFTQSDNFDKSVKIKGIMKVQFQDSQGNIQQQPQQLQQPQQQQRLSVYLQKSQPIIYSNQSINSVSSSNNYQNIQSGDNQNDAEIVNQQQNQQNRNQFAYQQNSINFFPPINNSQNNLGNSINQNRNSYIQNQIIQPNNISNDLYQLKFQPEQIIQNISNQQQNIDQCIDEQNKNLQNLQIDNNQQQYQNGSLQDNFQQQNYQQNLYNQPQNQYIDNNFFNPNQQSNAQQNQQPLPQQNGASFIFNYGNSIPIFRYGQSINQNVQIQNEGFNTQDNYNNFPFQYQQQEMLAQPQDNFQNQVQQQIDQNNYGNQQYQQNPQVGYNQGSSFVCQVPAKIQNQQITPNEQNSFNNSNNNMVGNSIPYQQYPIQPQQFMPIQQQYVNQKHFNQYQNNNYQANQYQNMQYQGNSFYYQGQDQQQNQHTQQQNNFGNSFVGNNNQMNQIDQYQNFGYYNNPNNQNVIDQSYGFQCNPKNSHNQTYQNNNLNQQQNNIQNVLQANIPMKLPSIFKMNLTNEDPLISSDIPVEPVFDSSTINIVKEISLQEKMNQSQQNQILMKYQSRNNQILKFTYSLPFNPFKFDITPTVKVDISTRSSSQGVISFQFHSEGATIGRLGTNSISFQDEPSISAYHAIIFYKKGEFFIQDIKSKAGTFIKIKSILLTPDLILKLGEGDLKIVKIESNIITLKANGSNKTINLNRQQSYKLGRCTLRCDLALPDVGSTLSNVHAEISINENKQIYLTDLNSANGTWLRLSEKGQRSNEHKLNLNDQILISNTKKIVIKELIQ